MKLSQLLISIFLLTACCSCKEESEFEAPRNLAEYKNTEFLPTLENKISEKTNAVYCATLLFAWAQLQQELGQPLNIPKQYTDLNLLQSSEGYKNTLLDDEYTASANVVGNEIIARASFEKSLPFETKLASFKNKLIFDGQKVAAFGQIGDSDLTKEPIVQIAYYQSDDEFVVRLLTKDTAHEIIIFKPKARFNTISSMVAKTDSLTAQGLKEKAQDEFQWKYYMADEDELIIPKFNFNIKTNFKTLEGNSFSTPSQTYRIA